MTFPNSFDSDLDRQNVGSLGSGSKLFDTQMISLKEILKTFILKKVVFFNYPACNENM